MAHHFVFSRDWRGYVRLCGWCHEPYDDGMHIEITTLAAYTKYVCPEDRGESGHSSRWTGAYLPDLRRVDDHLCACGTPLVEEDDELWQLSWEMSEPPGSPWRPVTVIRSKRAAENQRRGLLELVEQGEQIRAVHLVQRAVRR